MATVTGLMTVEQFRRLPEGNGEFAYELRHGELVKVSRPKLKHIVSQHRLFLLLSQHCGKRGRVFIEFPFRPLPEHEVWAADAAFISQERFAAIDPDDNLHGAPDLVAEVLSPSNTAMEMNEREAMCLQNGCREFWVIDPDRKLVKVAAADGRTITYRSGGSIPLPMLGGGTLSVDEIFQT